MAEHPEAVGSLEAVLPATEDQISDLAKLATSMVLKGEYLSEYIDDDFDENSSQAQFSSEWVFAEPNREMTVIKYLRPTSLFPKPVDDACFCITYCEYEGEWRNTNNPVDVTQYTFFASGSIWTVEKKFNRHGPFTSKGTPPELLSGDQLQAVMADYAADEARYQEAERLERELGLRFFSQADAKELKQRLEQAILNPSD